MGIARTVGHILTSPALALLSARCIVWCQAPETATLPGERLVFVSDRDGNDEIYVMNADGTGQTRLTHNQVPDKTPTWSPDGTRIAFVRELCRGPDPSEEVPPLGNHEVYVINADGTGETRLTDNSDEVVEGPLGPLDFLGPPLVWNWFPAWSPDGTRIAFSSNRDHDSDIYVMRADGSQQTRLTYSPANDQVPKWSPDGALIVFVRMEDDLPLYVMNADGTGEKRLTTDEAIALTRTWSLPKTAFTDDAGGDEEVCLMNADGTGKRRLTNNEAADTSPEWWAPPAP